MKRMQWYTKGELGDMHIVYGIVQGNGRALNEFIENAPQICINRTVIFLQMCIKICVIAGRYKVAGVVRVGHDRRIWFLWKEACWKSGTLFRVPYRICTVASFLGVSRCNVHLVFHADSLHAFHLQKIQLLIPDYHPKRVRFGQWYVQ